MSSGKGGAAPAAPDYLGLAAKQGDINANAARLGTQLSRVNQVTPYGSVTYRQVGGAPTQSVAPTQTSDGVPSTQRMQPNMGGNGMLGYALRQYQNGTGIPPSTSTGVSGATQIQPSDQWEQVTSLSPEQQRLFDINQSNQTNLGQTAADRLKTISGMGDFNGTDFDRRRIEDSLYGDASRYLDPQFQQREDATRTQLLNSGVREGSEGYQSAMDQLGRDRTLAYGDARDRAIAAGGNESTRALTDALRERAVPLQEFMSLYGGAQPNVPNAQTGAAQSVSPYDLLSAANQNYQTQVDAYNARSAGNSGLLGGLLGAAGQIGSAYIGRSDARLKEDIEPVGNLPDGTGVYEYSFRDDPSHRRETGVLAQEVEHTQPDAVLMGRDGYRRVDYRKVIARALREAA